LSGFKGFGAVVLYFDAARRVLKFPGFSRPEFFIGPLTMTDAIELCSSVAKSIFSVNVELDSIRVDVLDRAKSDKKFLCKIFLVVLMIAVFDE
jgi:hypothetical protein